MSTSFFVSGDHGGFGDYGGPARGGARGMIPRTPDRRTPDWHAPRRRTPDPHWPHRGRGPGNDAAWPAGWWILPMLLGGTATWAALIAAALT